VIRVIAHRGASRDRPENTIAAFDEALRQGCDGIELDVQLSRDAVPVVYHDRTLVRAGGGRRRVASLDWSELRRLGPGVRDGRRARTLRLPSLEQVLERYAGRTRLLVEIKTRERETSPERHLLLARETASRVRESGHAKRSAILSFDPQALAVCAEVAPEIPRVLNVKTTGGLGARRRRLLNGLHAISVNVHTLTPGFARDVRRAGIPLYAFTCNTPSRVGKALDAGAVAVISDRPGWLVDHLTAKGLRR